MTKKIDKEYCKNAMIGILVLLTYFILPTLENLPFAVAGININSLPLWLKVLYMIVFESVILFIIVLLLKDRLRKDKIDLKKNHKKYFEDGFKYWLIALGVMMFSNLIINTISSKGIASNEDAVRKLFDISPIYIYFSAVLWAPIVEELTFRRAIRNIIKPDTLFILVSGILFGALHVISSYQSYIDLLYIIPYSAPGIAFAYMLKKYNNTFVSIGFHLMHNGILIALQFFILLFS